MSSVYFRILGVIVRLTSFVWMVFWLQDPWQCWYWDSKSIKQLLQLEPHSSNPYACFSQTTVLICRGSWRRGSWKIAQPASLRLMAEFMHSRVTTKWDWSFVLVHKPVFGQLTDRSNSTLYSCNSYLIVKCNFDMETASVCLEFQRKKSKNLVQLLRQQLIILNKLTLESSTNQHHIQTNVLVYWTCIIILPK